MSNQLPADASHSISTAADEPGSTTNTNIQAQRHARYEDMPLDPERLEIRLFKAKKNVEADRQCLLTRMVTVSLLDPECPPYKALSYVWTDKTPLYDPRMIDGLQLGPHDGDEITSVAIERLGSSALAAIWQLVDMEEELTIWIDAICIDQTNEVERGSQVSIMSKIYQKAEEVVAWLGPDSEVYGVAFEVVDGLANFGHRYYDERWFQWCFQSDVDPETKRPDQYYDGPDGERIPAWNKTLEFAEQWLPEWFVPDQPSGNPPPKLYEFVLMGLSTFFSRAWIFQELAFSRKSRILSGGVSTSLANLLMAAKVWHALSAASEYSAVFGSGSDSHAHWNPGEYKTTHFGRPMIRNMRLWDMTNSLLQIRDVHRSAMPGSQLEYRLSLSFADFNATDPRDKIFALWGFVGDGPNSDLLRPDYSLSTEEVFSRAARYMVLTHRELTVLTTHEHGESAYEKFVRLTYPKTLVETQALHLPSWVPNWRSMSLRDNSISGEHMWLSDKQRGTKPVFSDDEFAQLVQFSADGSRLRIAGMHIGAIAQVHDGEIFPYPIKRDDPESVGPADFQTSFSNFLRLAAHGSEIVSQYFRFVFRSAEGTTNGLLDYGTDLGARLHTIKYLEDGKLAVHMEGVFGYQILKFLVGLLGERNLPALLASQGEDREAAESTQTSPEPRPQGELRFSQWWEALTCAFDIDTWPEPTKQRYQATALDTDPSAEARESMNTVRSWIGSKRFNFFIVPDVGLGISPQCIKPQEGDVVFRPAAHDGPMMLRPVGDGTYKNVGECFVSNSLVRSMDDQETMRGMTARYEWVEMV